MHALLQFILNEETLKENVREYWYDIYDFEFIDGVIARNGANGLDLLIYWTFSGIWQRDMGLLRR